MPKAAGGGEAIVLAAGELIAEVGAAIDLAGVAAEAAVFAQIDAALERVGAPDMHYVCLGGEELEVGPGGNSLAESVIASLSHDGERVFVTGLLVEVGGQADIAGLESGGDRSEDVALPEVVSGGTEVEDGSTRGRIDPVEHEAVVVAVDSIGL